MITISLCMIVRNDEEVLQRCLDSVYDLVDEIIVVDTGSIDRTKEIASKYTSKIYDFEWCNDFSAVRNFSFSKAVMQYQFWMDASEMLLQKDRIKFENLKYEMQADRDMVVMKQVLSSDENGTILNILSRERLVKRSNNYNWQGTAHEYIGYVSNCIFSDIHIWRKKKQNDFLQAERVKINKELISNQISLLPRSLFYYAKEVRDSNTVESINLFNAFLLTKGGSVWDNVNTCLEMGALYRNLGSAEDALKVFLHSFTYDLPVAEICCAIASVYMDKKEYDKAVFWYEMVFTLKVPANKALITNPDSWNFIPAIQLCVCYYALGNKEKAIHFNSLAESFKPEHPSVLFNRDFFVRLQEKTAYYVTEMLKMRNSN